VSKKALDLDFNGLMIETHRDPDEAWSDAKQQVRPVELEHMLKSLLQPGKAAQPGQASTELNSWRSEIDRIDALMIKLLKQRCDISRQIGEFKLTQKMPVVQLNRWEQMMVERLEWGQEQGVNSRLVKGIFDNIHQDSVARQRQITYERQQEMAD